MMGPQRGPINVCKQLWCNSSACCGAIVVLAVVQQQCLLWSSTSAYCGALLVLAVELYQYLLWSSTSAYCGALLVLAVELYQCLLWSSTSAYCGALLVLAVELYQYLLWSSTSAYCGALLVLAVELYQCLLWSFTSACCEALLVPAVGALQSAWCTAPANCVQTARLLCSLTAQKPQLLLVMSCASSKNCGDYSVLTSHAVHHTPHTLHHTPYTAHTTSTPAVVDVTDVLHVYTQLEPVIRHSHLLYWPVNILERFRNCFYPGDVDQLDHCKVFWTDSAVFKEDIDTSSIAIL